MSRSGVLTWGRVTGGSVARTVVLLAALAGLFAMHGMADHGTTHHGATSAVTGAASAKHLAMESAHPDLVANTQTPTSVNPPSLAPSPAGDLTQDAGGVAMALCLAVLVALVLVRFGSLVSHWFELRRSVAGAASTVMVARARAPDPLDLLVLSVQRC